MLNVKINKRLILIMGTVYTVLVLGVVIFYFVNPFNNECVKGNCLNGYGIFIHQSGLKYEGEWKNGVRHGNGKLTYPETYVYEGEWKNNVMDGHGTMVSYYKYVGEWKNGKKHGKGTIYFSGKTYEGHWDNNRMHGRGILTYPGGFKWIGEWNYNRLYNGKGTIVERDGRRYEGQMNAGKMYGEITITNPDGSIFTGKWMNGSKDLHGTIIYPDGRKFNKTIELDKSFLN